MEAVVHPTLGELNNSYKFPVRKEFPELSVTIADEAFLEKGVEFVEGCQGIDVEELNNLFVKVKFPSRDLDKLRKALENSYFVLWARYCKPSSRFAKEGQLLGFARVISDGIFYSSVWDVAVVPAWQRGGVGKALMERVLIKLVNDRIQHICLYSEDHAVNFYKKLGFSIDLQTFSAMAYNGR